MELREATILLTGATGGLGRAMAAELAGRGGTLILSSRKGEELERLAAELPGEGHRVVVADLAAEGGVERLLEQAGDYDVLIANAGVGSGTALADADLEAISRIVRVNLEAPAKMAASAVQQMVPRRAGHIVLISSLAGKVVPSGAALYAATKSGLRALGRGLAGDLKGSGVGVSVIYPGFVREAGMFHDAGGRSPAGMGTATPAEVAEAVAEGIERERLEVDVAPVQQRSFANFALHFPGIAGRIERAAGGGGLAEQAEKR